MLAGEKLPCLFILGGTPLGEGSSYMYTDMYPLYYFILIYVYILSFYQYTAGGFFFSAARMQHISQWEKYKERMFKLSLITARVWPLREKCGQTQASMETTNRMAVNFYRLNSQDNRSRLTHISLLLNEYPSTCQGTDYPPPPLVSKSSLPESTEIQPVPLISSSRLPVSTWLFKLFIQTWGFKAWG